MANTTIDEDTVRKAADAIAEFGTVAFQPEFLRWDKDVKLGVASLVWNCVTGSTVRRGREVQPVSLAIPIVPDLQPLCDRLLDVRLKRWPDADWMVMGWDARVDAGEIVFAFDLWWDEAQHGQPCEMTWITTTPGHAGVN